MKLHASGEDYLETILVLQNRYFGMNIEEIFIYEEEKHEEK